MTPINTPNSAVAPQCEFLYEAIVDIGERQSLGRGPLGERFIIPIVGGTFKGIEGLHGVVLPGGADRQLLRADGVKELDALYEMQTHDGVVLTIHNRVLIDDNPPVPRYARSVVHITAPDGSYAWLSRRVLVGTLQSLMPVKQAVCITVYMLQ